MLLPKAISPHIDKTQKSLLSLIAGNYDQETDFFRTRHAKRSPQALRHLLVVELFQVHPPHSHYLADEINLVSAQVLVSKVL